MNVIRIWCGSLCGKNKNMATFHLIPNTSNCIDMQGKYGEFCLPPKEDCTPTSTDGLLSNCDDRWNCNLCPTDVEYLIPVIRGDKFMIQTQIVDRYNVDPKNPTTGFGDWLHVEVVLKRPFGENVQGLLTASSRRYVGHDGQRSYQVVEIDTSYGAFRNASCFYFKYIVGDKIPSGAISIASSGEDATRNRLQIVLNEPLAQYFEIGREYTLARSDVAYLGVVAEIVDDFTIVFEENQFGLPIQNDYTEIVQDQNIYENVTEEFCTEEFGFVDECNADKTLTIRGDFERYDCFGNYYGNPVGYYGTGAFKFDNTLRYWADMRNTSGSLEKDLFATKTRRVVTQDIYTFTLSNTPIPPFAHRMLIKMYLAAPKTYINGREYTIQNFAVRNKIDYNNMLLYNADLFIQCEIQAYKC